MRFTKITHWMFLILLTAVSLDTTLSSDYLPNKLSPASILEQQANIHTFSKSEEKKIARLEKKLKTEKDDYTTFINILKKNKPLLTQAALKRLLEKDKSAFSYILPHLKRFTSSDALDKKTYQHIVIPLLNNLHLLPNNKEAISILTKIADSAIFPKKIDHNTKQRIIADIIAATSSKKTNFNEATIIDALYAPLFDHTTYAKILVDMLFPNTYQAGKIHLSLHKLNINIRKTLLASILNPNKQKSLINKHIIHILSENNSVEKEEQITKFLNTNYNKLSQAAAFCRLENIPVSDAFMDFIIRRRQVSLLSAIQPDNADQDYITLLRDLLETEKLKHKKHNVIKDAILSIHTIFTFTGKDTAVPKNIILEMKSAIADFHQEKTGNKKFNERIKSIKKEALAVPLIETIGEMTNRLTPTDKNEIKRVIYKMMDQDPAAYDYLFNLCDIYNRTNTRFQTTAKHIRETMTYLMNTDGDLAKLNKWLYTEAAWNQETYRTLIKHGYSESFWKNPTRQTYFASQETSAQAEKLIDRIKRLKARNNKTVKQKNQLEFLTEELNRIRKKEPKIIVELEFDFLKNSHSGAVLHDSISPHKAFEIVPPALALDTATVFMHVYNEETKKPLSSILFILTPQGLVDMGFPTDSPAFEAPVFDHIAQLVNAKIVPQVNINSKKTSYVDSATYNYAAENKMLLAQKMESVKKEPWNLNRSTDTKNPRHYATGGNRDINGIQHGVFNTSFVINQYSIKRYHFVSLELMQQELDLKADTHLYSDFLNRLRQQVIEKSKTLDTKEQEKQYIKEMLPSLTALKNYMEQNSILPEKLLKRRHTLVRIIPEKLIDFIDEEIEIKATPLNSFFAQIREKKSAKALAPQSA